MDDTYFGKLVEEAIDRVPQEFKKRLENVSIVIEDRPGLDVLRNFGRGVLIFGLYQGIPHTRRRYYGIGGQLPDKITIYKEPILMVNSTDEEIREQVRDTVVHEIGHHFGLSDEEIYKAMH